MFMSHHKVVNEITVSSRALWNKSHLIVPTELRERIKQFINRLFYPNPIIPISNINYVLDIYSSNNIDVPPYISCIVDCEPACKLITEVVESVMLELFLEKCRAGNLFHKAILGESLIIRTDEYIHSARINMSSDCSCIEVSGSVDLTLTSTYFGSNRKPKDVRMKLVKNSATTK